MYLGASTEVHGIMLWQRTAFWRIELPQDCLLISSKALQGPTSPLITFASEECLWQPWTHLLKLAADTSVLASRNQHKSTV